MDMELIRTRKSVRTFDGQGISEEDREKLSAYIRSIENPYHIPVRFMILGAKKHGLSSPVISGEHLYITAKVPKTEHCEEAFGYAFEKMVLYAWSLGIGTTWIGGTMKREVFEREAGVTEDEIMPCVSPLGYPAKNRSLKEMAMRTAIRADKRLPSDELFFDNDFGTPLHTDDITVNNALEAVRLAPSAVNKQPWRIVRQGDSYHFYKKKNVSGGGDWDVQKVDLGIALCHFMGIAGGALTVSSPDIQTADDTEYIATVTL
ncbi:MAG: nitroreductase family protein [Oscillospiraceae bacterium]|nr:nitroreductase family protein [Oscillospiraceae bacterium]